jgi:putative endonuclease
LRSLKDNKLYIGSSCNPTKRLKEHNLGKNISTKQRMPFVLIYKEKFNTKKLAEKRERFFKTGKGHIVLYMILKDSPSIKTLEGSPPPPLFGEGAPPK